MKVHTLPYYTVHTVYITLHINILVFKYYIRAGRFGTD
jgi:hypothetical protein